MIESIVNSILERLQGIFLGWIPQGVWDAFGWWPWVLGAIGVTVLVSVLYRVYKVGGWPGLVVAVGAIGTALGYVLGRRSTAPPNKPVPVEQPIKKKKVRRKHTKTIFDRDGNGINDRDE